MQNPNGKGVCGFIDCNTPVLAKGLCAKHYHKVRNDALRKGKPPKPVCFQNGCDKISVSKGFCTSHYEQYRKKNPINPRYCKLSDCYRLVHADDMCELHYRRLKRTGTTDRRAPKPAICRVKDCKDAVHAQRYCQKHYNAWKLHGDPLFVKVRKTDKTQLCRINGCDSHQVQNQMCQKHLDKYKYQRKMKRYPNAVSYIEDMNGLRCTADGCARRKVAHGLCATHYGRARREGTRPDTSN